MSSDVAPVKIEATSQNEKPNCDHLGAVPTENGVNYRVWAPKVERVVVKISSRDGDNARTLPLQKASSGYHHGLDRLGSAGDCYHYLLDNQEPFPDPASRFQEKDVHGRSVVVDPKQYRWTDHQYSRPAFRDIVIYELHIGTFSQEGTFRGAIKHLDHLATLGVNAIELMPIADFPGDRNWGYDGVLKYAPARCYGRPDDLRALVDAAHARGLAVILDVVYNHFGPDGNYIAQFGDDYFSTKHSTPWGAALNFDGPSAGPVRHFFRLNTAYWMEEFHIDGFRFDAAHEIIDESPIHILSEMTDEVHARGGFAIAEDERNEARVITACKNGGYGFDAVWADDFHHTSRVSVTREQFAYLADFRGSANEIAETLRQGWFYTGQYQNSFKAPRGTIASRLPPERFLHCISNHDQVGNRALGERLHQTISPSAYRALSALLCLSPYTPMLFMGQEWAATSPFLYFTDFDGDLGRAVTEGRRKEFSSFPDFNEPHEQATIPDPQSLSTFSQSKLKWDHASHKDHAHILALYRACLDVRKDHPALRPTTKQHWEVLELHWGPIAIHYKTHGTRYILVFDLQGARSGELPEALQRPEKWQLLLSSDDVKFGGTAQNTLVDGRNLAFRSPGLLLLRS